MRRLLQKIFKPLFVWLADRYSAAPKRETVFKSLSRLYKSISIKNKKGIVLEITAADKFIILSDQHKGARDFADDFATNEACYITALNYYLQEGFSYINLGDAEELLKYDVKNVMPKNENALKAESVFHAVNKYYRMYGNHDIMWKTNMDVTAHLEKFFTSPLHIYEGLILRIKINEEALDIFLTHGHQGDAISDGNAFSGWFLAKIWAPVQRFLEININTPAHDPGLRNKHNRMMYDWSSKRKRVLLITGHTHKPVFASGKYATKESHKIDTDKSSHNTKPTYFNTGCCCFDDGDISGIEIAGGSIRLIKWNNDNKTPAREVLEEKTISSLINDL